MTTMAPTSHGPRVNAVNGGILQHALSSTDPTFQALYRKYLSSRIYSWSPRPDRPDQMDEQAAFVASKARFSVCLGGTGSGKTDAAAYRTARYLLDTPPPRFRCPFWVIGESYELTCAVCWDEKLSTFIPKSEISSIHWYKQARNWPFEVLLKNGWSIQFKSYDQGREKLQAASIGGFWLNEMPPMAIVTEVLGRCRDYDSPGWADFTPLKAEYAREWETAYDEPPDGWQFYHLNTRLNDALADGWADRFLSSITEDMRETREKGTFSTFSGRVFKEWRDKLHVIPPFEIPRGWRHIRGIDFGYSNPFACVWIAIPPNGEEYYVYAEHYEREQTLSHHAGRIKMVQWDTTDPHYGATYCDPSAAQGIADLRRTHGITGLVAANNDVLAGIEFVRRMLLPVASGRPRLFIFATCEQLIREIKGYHWSPSIGKGLRERDAIDMPVKINDHAIDALRYAIYTHAITTRAHGGVEAIPASSTQREWVAKSGRFLPGSRKMGDG